MSIASVVIVTFNSRAHFARQKAALEAQTFADFQLVVWDNASKPDQRPQADDFPAGAIIAQSAENLGFAAGNNRAAELAESDFIVLLNPDAFPEADWLEKLVAAARADPKTGAFGCTQIMADDTARFDGLGDCYHAAGIPWRGGYGWRREGVQQSTNTFSACGASVLYRQEAWRACKGFDESFFAYCEDVELGFRLRLLGWPTKQVPDAIVHHIGGASSGKRSDFAVFHGTRNRLWTFVKCMPSPLIWLLAPAHIAMNCAFLAIAPFRGTGPATWRGVGAALKGLGPVLKQRADLQARRTASIASIAKSLTWNPLMMVKRAPPKD